MIAHVDLDAFFAAVEQRDRPTLRGKPVVVGADPKGGQGRGVVSTCSYEARRYGIRSAMPISQAFRLCPHAAFLPVDGAKYHRVSQVVFKILEEFTPDIEPVSIDEAFLDLTGSSHLFGGIEKACWMVKQRIFETTRLTVSVGAAPVKFVAKIASAHYKPDGFLIINPENVMGFLRPLSIETLWGVGPRTQQALAKIGITTIGQLADANEQTLIKYFGVHGAYLFALANGIDPRPVVCEGSVKSISHEHTFDTDCKDPEEVERIIMGIVERLSHRLRKQELEGKTLTAKIRLQDFRTFSRTVTLGERTNHVGRLYREGKNLFRQFYRPGMAIRLIGLRVTNFDDPYVRNSLFDDPQIRQSERVHHAVDQIKNRFGEDAIHRAL